MSLNPAPMTRKAWWILLAALAGFTGLVYLPVLDNGLVWDDWANIARNPHYKGIGPEQLRWAFATFRLGHYQPLAWISLGLDHALWGDDYRGYHFTNVVLHAVNAFLFGLIALRLLGTTRTSTGAAGRRRLAAVGSLVAAATFALHPLRVESVAWLSERRQLVSAVFFLLAVLVYLRGFEDEARPRPTGLALASVTALYGLSLLAMPLGIALPVVLLVLDAYPLRRAPSGAGVAGWLRPLVEKTPLFALAAAFAVSALAAQRASGALLSIERYDFWQRSAQAAYGTLFYPRALFAVSWSPLYERPFNLDPLEARFVLSALGSVVVTGLLILYRRAFPAGLAVWLVYLALLVPISGLAQSGIQLVADRYSYLSGLGFALLLGMGAAIGWRACSGPAARALWSVGLAALLGLWSWASWNQQAVWRDDVSFWNHVLRRGPSALAHTSLGSIALRQGDPASAGEHMTSALEIAPTYGRAWRKMLEVLDVDRHGLDTSELERIVVALEGGIEYHSDTAIAWYVLGLARARLGETDRAASDFERAVAIQPDHARAWLRLGVARLASSRPDAAIQALERAVELDPAGPEARTWLDLARKRAATTP